MTYDLNLIRRFDAVHRNNSFTRAASELGMTHSALTKSIQTLEENWGVKLFERTTRTISPTEAGHRLAILAPELLAQAANVRNNTTAGSLQLNIICGAAVAENYIPAALLKFREKRPDIAMNVETMEPAAASDLLIKHQTELLLFHATTIDAMPNRKDFDIKILFSEPYFMVYRAGHKVASCENSLESVLNFEWIVAGFGSRYQTGLPKALIAKFKNHGFPKYRLMSQSACLNIVSQSDLITLLPQSTALKAIKGGEFGARPFPGKAVLSLAAATLSKSSNSNNLEEFLACMAI